MPHLHGHTCKALADASLALLEARHISTGRIALCLPGVRRDAVQPRSAERRLERLRANPRLQVRPCALALARHAWQQLARRGVELPLLLDETPMRNELRVLKLSLGYEGRAIPLVWFCYSPDRLPHRLPLLVVRLLLGLKRALPDPPEGARVTLFADRGLGWPLLIDLCRRLGWDFVLRVQGQTRVRTAEGQECSIAQFAPRPGTHWYGSAQVFKEAGWRNVNVVARWRRGVKEPWLLVTSWPAQARCCRAYRHRMQQEESFRDEKSSGFEWQKSQVREPAHADRLLLVLALATHLVQGIGSALRRSQSRRTFERSGRPRLSIFQLGLRFLTWASPQLLLRRLSIRFPALRPCLSRPPP
jgi:hypothetical protein